MPKALAYLIEKVEELDRKLESLGDTSASGKDVWMGIKELYAYLSTRPATQTVYGWTSAHLILFRKRGEHFMFMKSRICKGRYANEKWSAAQTAALHLYGFRYFGVGDYFTSSKSTSVTSFSSLWGAPAPGCAPAAPALAPAAAWAL